MKTTASRIDRLATRIRESVCPFTIASLVRSLSADLDPAALSALVGLLGHKHDAKGSIERAILRYGEHAEDTLRAAESAIARDLLEEMSLRNRFLQVGCF